MLRGIVITSTLLALASSALGADAKAIYDKKCKLCHSLAGEKGQKADLGGALDDVGAKHDEAWLRAYLTDPKSKKPDSKMPKMKFTDEEMDALVKFMASQKGPAPAK
jgi:mono/diheme cytochrome c family protein